MYTSIKTVILVFLLSTTSLYALSETDIKGIMLQRIGSFISWPQLPEKTIKICVVGDNDFAQNLQKLYKDKELHDRSLDVISVDSTTDKRILLSCQIIYIVNANKNTLNQIAQILKNQTTLIVGNNYDNIYDGAGVVFYLDNNKYKIVINEKRLSDTHLKADYRLLKLAKIVEPNGENNEVK
ncbi:MAG: YfiR family protein [Sulfuricurvum sp.]|nr:YfiR family protein [Sulfuricurvum sp.]